eukprot:5301508-Lingulodinium_polyedra.AAC.1
MLWTRWLMGSAGRHATKSKVRPTLGEAGSRHRPLVGRRLPSTAGRCQRSVWRPRRCKGS